MIISNEVPRAFISSTYHDLRDQRQLVVQELLAAQVMPSGMELWPGSGQRLWQTIQSFIRQCDVYILIVAGRYGSIAPLELSLSESMSWTRLEYEFARSLGKPIIPLVHGAPQSLRSEQVDADASLIENFRDALSNEITPKRYTSDTELVSALHQGPYNVRQELGRDTTSHRRGNLHPVLEEYFRKVYDRRYRLISAEWSHDKSDRIEGRWDGACRLRRVFTPTWPEGVTSWSYSLNKPAGDYETFFSEYPPKMTLEGWERTDSGRVSLRPSPRRMTKSNYQHDIDFNPPVRCGESCDFSAQIDLPGYRFAMREDVVRASDTAVDGPRDYEATSYKIEFPTDKLILSVRLPLDLGVELMGVQILSNRVSVDSDEMVRLENSGGYQVIQEEIEGRKFVRMHLEVTHPVPQRTYQLRWRPPRKELATSEVAGAMVSQPRSSLESTLKL